MAGCACVYVCASNIKSIFSTGNCSTASHRGVELKRGIFHGTTLISTQNSNVIPFNFKQKEKYDWTYVSGQSLAFQRSPAPATHKLGSFDVPLFIFSLFLRLYCFLMGLWPLWRISFMHLQFDSSWSFVLKRGGHAVPYSIFYSVTLYTQVRIDTHTHLRTPTG